MHEQSAPMRRLNIWGVGFMSLFILLVVFAVLFLSFIFDQPHGDLPVSADDNQARYQVCTTLGPQSSECLDDAIFISGDILFLSFYALGLVVLICLAGLFMVESKLMRFGVFPLQLLSVIIAGILLICGSTLIFYPILDLAAKLIRPLSFMMLGFNYASMLLLSYRIQPWQKKWWSLFGVIPVLTGIVSPILLFLFRPSGWKWRPEALPLLILGEASFFLIFGLSVDGVLDGGLFIFTYLFLGLAFLLIVRNEQVLKDVLW